ncbi:MAG: ABC transporter permease [Spirochaetes bacterium]|nr:ABC transporter permease [Spirochaetota bacterium]
MFIQYVLSNLSLVVREIIKIAPKTFISSFGIIFLIACAAISLSIKNSASDYLKKRVFGELKINQIKITPKSPKSISNFSSVGIAIDEKKIKKISGIKDITDLHKVIRLNAPASLKAGMLGMYLKTDMLISGVDKSFFKDSIPNWKQFKHNGYVPVIIPVFILDIYNNFAATSGLPALGPKALNLLSIEMIIGSSSFTGNKENSRKFRTKVFGFTETITTAGIIVPDDFIMEFCRCNSADIHLAGSCYSCIMLIGNVSDISKIPLITKKVRSMGLNIESQADIAKKTDKALFVLNFILFGITAVIFFLTVISIFNSYLAVVYNRSYILSVQRMLGASKIRIIFMFMLEAGMIGALYGVLGYFTGYYILVYMNNHLHEWIPVVQGLSLTLKPFQYFSQLFMASIALSIISAFIPSIFASSLNLFKAVKR